MSFWFVNVSELCHIFKRFISYTYILTKEYLELIKIAVQLLQKQIFSKVPSTSPSRLVHAVISLICIPEELVPNPGWEANYPDKSSLQLPCIFKVGVGIES